MSSYPRIDAPEEYRSCETHAIGQLLKHCFGNTLPLDSRVSIERYRPSFPPDTIHCTVSVDGQEVGATVGTWLYKEPGKPAACVFTLFPKFSA
jgi:hypothetical protein